MNTRENAYGKLVFVTFSIGFGDVLAKFAGQDAIALEKGMGKGFAVGKSVV